jgi:sugar lactone lactonase YvrE
MSSTHSATVTGTGVITIPGDRYFPEGVTVTRDGTFYVGSMYEGCIMKAPPGAKAAEPFIESGANGLVSVLGLYADEARGLLWACSADAGNGKLTGNAPVGIRAFGLQTGAARARFDFPGGGFPNDLTIDDQGNVYVTDSWTPRILRLSGEKFSKGTAGPTLEEWINDPQLGVEQWSLNGIDFDRDNAVIYTVNQRAGKLFRIAVEPDGSAGAVTLISTSLPIRRPDGLKVVGHNILATAEGGAGGMAAMRIAGATAQVTRVSEGLDQVATFAFYRGSAWIVENQADHFWDPAHAGPDADPPFRLVEIPLNLNAN